MVRTILNQAQLNSFYKNKAYTHWQENRKALQSFFREIYMLSYIITVQFIQR